ncbi:MAG: cold-shock protein [Planctomycetes bacterium]|nr:cold-shock protein [Planctomycetota bacterium]MCW8134642.1 cold-shock protein [Planctomycetota bacterium]
MAITRVKTSGTVKWYDPRKGYGYATRTGSPEVFLHYGAIRSDGVIELKAGQQIEFMLEQTPRGAVAHEIRVVKS